LLIALLAVATESRAQRTPRPPARSSLAAVDCTTAPNQRVWRQFRVRHVAPYQAFAVARDGNDWVVVVSEPPPTLPRDQLAPLIVDLFGGILVGQDRCRSRTGLDGWLEDVVLRVRPGPQTASVLSGETLEPWQAPADIVDRLRILQAVLHGTNQGFWIDDLDSPPAAMRVDEVRVGPGQLRKWIEEGRGSWISLAGDGGALNGHQLRAASAPGAYVRGDGLVALVVPVAARPEALASSFRLFAVESDLLLGAAQPNNGPMILIGRARRLPLSTLPPLRFEDFDRFLKNPAAELAQSYERTRIFAGKIQRDPYRDWDWAPILLSAQLDDTEFGTLLNQADQILKSWSQAGQVRYFAFNYRSPQVYPFGGIPGSIYFDGKYGTDSLIFNWNTDDFAFLTEFPGLDALTVDRTGALPILYLPQSSLLDEGPPEIAAQVKDIEQRAQRDAEQQADRARDLFAQTGDPILTRVARNVLLFQAAQSFLKRSGSAATQRTSRSDRTAQVLQREGGNWVKRVANGTAGPGVAPQVVAAVRTFLRRTGLDASGAAAVVAVPQRLEVQLAGAEQRRAQRLQQAKTERDAHDRLRAEASREFERACVAAQGKLITPPAPDPRFCDYPSSQAAKFARVMELGRKLKAAEAEFAATHASFERADAENDRARIQLSALQELSNVLQRYGRSADLPQILEAVVGAVANPEPQGSIRTPSVVLSQNEVDRQSIGGHNIDLSPLRVRVSTKVTAPRRNPTSNVLEVPTAQANNVAAIARGRGTATTPPQSLRPGPGTLLANMRRAAQGEAANPTVARTMLARAQTCACDAVITWMDDGTIVIVRKAPPPGTARQVFGQSAVIDVLAGPPALGRVHFENFTETTVRNIAASVDVIRSPGGGRRFGSLFGSREEGSRILVANRDRRPEFLRLSDGGDPAALAVRSNPRLARVETIDEAAWRDAFGGAGTGQGERFIVRFPKAGASSVEPIGIRLAERPGHAGWLERLRTGLQQWLGRQPAAPMPRDELVMGLREEIRRQVGDARAEFFFQHNSRVVRVADSRAANPSYRRRS
jgi:hypothetical protein